VDLREYWLDAGGKVLHVEAARLEPRVANWLVRQSSASGERGGYYDLLSEHRPRPHLGRRPDGAQFAEPEANIAAMLVIVESLARPLRSVWDGCTRREFNIGYECGAEPWAFNQGLRAELLGQMAAVGASLRVTLYPGPRASHA
jgi:hypothetical protein